MKELIEYQLVSWMAIGTIVIGVLFVEFIMDNLYYRRLNKKTLLLDERFENGREWYDKVYGKANKHWGSKTELK